MKDVNWFNLIHNAEDNLLLHEGFSRQEVPFYHLAVDDLYLFEMFAYLDQTRP